MAEKRQKQTGIRMVWWGWVRDDREIVNKKSGKHPLVSDNSLMGAVKGWVRVIAHHSVFHPLLVLQFFACCSFIFSNPFTSTNQHSIFLYHFPLSIFLSLSQTMLCPYRDRLHTPHIIRLFIYFYCLQSSQYQRCDYLNARHEQMKLNSGWVIHSILAPSSCVLTNTAPIEIQPRALEPAKCPCSLFRVVADEDTKRERKMKELMKMEKKNSRFVCYVFVSCVVKDLSTWSMHIGE